MYFSEITNSFGDTFSFVSLIFFLFLLLFWCFNSVVYCAVPEKIHTHPLEGHRKFLGEGGLKSQILEAK